MSNFAYNSTSTPPSPSINAANDAPPPYEQTPFMRAESNSLLSYYRARSIENVVPQQAQPIAPVEPIAKYESMDDALERYKKYTLAAILGLAGVSVAGSVVALYSIFAGFTFLPGMMKMVADEETKRTNLTLLFGTIGTMVALYQTDSMKDIMNATVAKVEGIWNWDNMSNTTHEFLSFNVAITLSIMAGALAQALVNGAIAAKDEHSRNRMRI